MESWTTRLKKSIPPDLPGPIPNPKTWTREQLKQVAEYWKHRRETTLANHPMPWPLRVAEAEYCAFHERETLHALECKRLGVGTPNPTSPRR